MKILIVGSGGREHALAWKTAQSAQVTQVFVAPGNAGTAREAKVHNLNISAENIPALIEFAQQEHIDLTIIGPEVPLAMGIVDAFTEHHLPCFGPSQAASQLESSKQFSKDFMKKYDIPTAEYKCFTDAKSAKDYLATQRFPMVIKADGLAAGKGVVIAQDYAQACHTLDDMLTEHQFGDAGAKVVIESFLQGEEASFIAMVSGDQILPLATSQDHKARDDGDQGPNTGGMGAYSPAPVVTTEIHQKIMEQVMIPTAKGMIAEGTPFIGFLYAGVMISPDQEIKVLEFNCRFGDPETQPILMRLKNDLAEVCLAALSGQLNQQQLIWDPRPALGVVMVAGGYPNSYQQGNEISGLDQINDPAVKVFHAGTQLKDGNVVTAGGRVLCVTALGEDIKAAQQKAYQAANKIHWDQVYYRKDIGHRAL